MMHEISKEMFKQRVCNKSDHNFAIIDLYEDRETKDAVLKKTEYIAYSESFVADVETKYPDKTGNVLLFSLKRGDDRPEKAANDLKNAGYHFVYYYSGDLDDRLVDKGLN
ncbi:hypothetical protein N9B72_02410 [Bacteriovoracaceae bacterium]|nr:hypothetical protein [Bacteriovoracaceae bacterium]